MRTAAHAKAAQASASLPNSRAAAIQAVPKQVARLAAVVLANAGAARLALAEEFQGVPELSLPEINLPSVSVDAGAASDLASFVSDNPLLIGGGALILLAPVAIATLFNGGGGGGVKSTTVERTLQALAEDPRVVLVDVRSKGEIKAQGSPDLRAVKRKSLALPLALTVKGEEVADPEFADKFARLPGISEESLVILLDADGRDGKAAAGAIADSVAKAYFVAGGAEAWEEVGPWRAPSKGLSLSLPDLRQVGASLDGLAEDFRAAPSLAKGAVAAGALLGASVLVINEVDVVLELAGLWAAGNFLLKLVFADEREKTFTEIKTLVDDKVSRGCGAGAAHGDGNY
jgi:chitinase domain-containing protein 1